ncbi:hypothetical protein ACFUJR_21130 [Streptomyces sp. NPDC057271]|uniref:hypothetical protein n=1 Tax=unclassified Streptomyces TaxID=2593676 RepID=UPI00363F126A
MVGARASEALASLRADTAVLTSAHPDHVFRTATERLARWQAAGLDTGVFHAGFYMAWDRYAELGLSQMLPLHRVLVGAESSRPGAFGGFHHPDQGYRHLQMIALVTMHGPLGRDVPERASLALLDLLRAYAHDCLHFGSRRRYVDIDGRLVRTQYGINFRRASGRTYSAADPKDAPHTRNLGVVMEGACDREARRITREAAARVGVEEPGDAVGRLAFRDVTGTLAGDEGAASADAPTDEITRYTGALWRYEAGVNRRYASFLDEFAPGEQEDLHTLVLRSVISGATGALSGWLDDRHGPGTFAGLFRTLEYFDPGVPV